MQLHHVIDGPADAPTLVLGGSIGQHPRDVGATDPGAHTPAPGGPLRPPGSRWLARGARSVLARRPGPGRGRSARRPRPRTRPRRRLVARRNGLHVARRPRARAGRPPGLAVHLGGAGTALALGGAGGDGSSRGHEGHRLDHPRALVHPAAGRSAAGRHGRLRSHDERHRRRGLCLVLRGHRRHAPPAGAPPGAGAEPRDRRGRRTPRPHPSTAQAIAERIPNARLEVVEGAAHLASWERADEVNALLLEHLCGAGGAP